MVVSCRTLLVLLRLGYRVVRRLRSVAWVWNAEAEFDEAEFGETERV